MRYKRLLALVFSLALAVNAIVAVTGFAGAQQTHVAITGVSVSPTDPAPGEEFTLTANISNLADGDGTVTVTDVYVRSQSSLKEYFRAEGPGSIAPGNEMSVPLSLSIDDVGSKNLQVYATVKMPGGGYKTLKYPQLVTVSEPDEVLVSIPSMGVAVDEETPVNVTVANGDSNAVSSVQVNISGDATVEEPRRIAASIESGTDKSFQYDVTFDELGTRTLEATVTYTTSQGITRTVTDSTAFEVANESSDSGLQVDGRIELVGVDTSGSGVVTIQGDAANVGGTNAKSVLLRVKDTESVTPMSSSGEYFVGPVNASKFDTFELIARTTDEASSVPVQIEYIVNGEKRTHTTRINISSSRGGFRTVSGIDDRAERRTVSRDRQPGLLSSLGSLLVPVLVVGLIGGGLYLWKRR